MVTHKHTFSKLYSSYGTLSTLFLFFHQRMGGLHGDVDRDFKNTNLNVLARDVANLHEDVRRLFEVVIELTKLTKNETDQIDLGLTALRNQVNGK